MKRLNLRRRGNSRVREGNIVLELKNVVPKMNGSTYIIFSEYMEVAGVFFLHFCEYVQESQMTGFFGRWC